MTHDPRTDAVLEHYDASFDDSIKRLFELLRIRSISTDPAYKEHCIEAAHYLADELTSLGFEARAQKTIGHPIVVGHYTSGNADSPRALFYGHYDVQPADPLELWKREPFEPQIIERKDGSKAISARGVSDDKAQLRTFVEACRAWKEETGDIPCNLIVLFEGEEESGSPSMAPFLESFGQELQADFALVCDTTMWDRNTPAITISLRGNSAGELTIKAANRDLHSGLYGAAARNPINLMTQILGRLQDEDGRVTLPGFYSGVEEPSEEFLTLWRDLDFDGKAFLGAVGLSEPAGEKDRSILEQIWSRPTCDINGIIGGYTGEGFKTVIPAEASAKISFRLVPDQDPNAIWESFEAFVRERLPADCEAVFTRRGGSPGLSLSASNPALKLCVDALDEEWGTKTALMGVGGSIPIVGAFSEKLGMDTILVGFALDDDQIHSPNEKYEMNSFFKGGRSWIRILGALGQGVS